MFMNIIAWGPQVNSLLHIRILIPIEFKHDPIKEHMSGLEHIYEWFGNGCKTAKKPKLSKHTSVKFVYPKY